MKSPFIIVEWEGGLYERVSFWRWIEFICTPPDGIESDYSGMEIPVTIFAAGKPQPKCFAGIQLGKAAFGHDFINSRHKFHGKWRWTNQLTEV